MRVLRTKNYEEFAALPAQARDDRLFALREEKQMLEKYRRAKDPKAALSKRIAALNAVIKRAREEEFGMMTHL